MIAYLLPGFVALWGISYQSPAVRMWLTGNPPGYSVTIGGFLYTTMAAVIAGLFCSTVRWLLIDTLHHHTGIARPDWDFGELQKKLAAYQLMEENHYRYYQFYANVNVAITIGYFSWRFAASRGVFIWADLLFIATVLLFHLGSRDTLQKYYSRVAYLLRDDR